MRAHAFSREHNLKAEGLNWPSARASSSATARRIFWPILKTAPAYGRLTRLLTRGNLRAEKGFCLLKREDLLDEAFELQLALMPQSTFAGKEDARETERHYDDFDTHDAISSDAQAAGPLKNLIPRLREASGGPVWLAAAMTYGASMRGDLAWRKRLALEADAPLLAVNDVLMHVAERRPLQDVLTAIRLGVNLDEVGRRLEANAERHLKDAAEMARLFAEAPEAIGETLHFLVGVAFSLDELRGDYPEELREGFATPQEALRAFAYEGAAERCEGHIPDKMKEAIEHELAIVAKLGYAAYFLSPCMTSLRFARTKEILCQGRGSAANSTLCFCLKITDVRSETKRAFVRALRLRGSPGAARH